MDQNRFMPKINYNNQIHERQSINVGIIGTGWIAETYIEALKDIPDANIIAGADIVPDKAKRFFMHYGMTDVRVYTNHNQMLEMEKLDAVCICTYNTTHATCAIDALRHGVHVLLEKPMCSTLEEAIQIVHAEKETGKIVSLGFQTRMDPNFELIRNIVASGELGKVYYIQTGGGRRRGIPNRTFIEKKTAGMGAAGDIGCYSLDLVLYAIGYPKPLTVSGYTSNYFGTSEKYNSYYAKNFEVEDFAAAFIRLEGDILVDFRIAWSMNMDSTGDTLILGTEGGLRIPASESWSRTIQGPLTLYKEIAGQQVKTEIPLISFKEDLWKRKLKSFIDCVINQGEPPVSTSQILYNQAIIDGMLASARLGKECEISIPT